MVEVGMKILFFLVLPLLAFPAVIGTLLDYEFQSAHPLFGVVDGEGLKSMSPLPYRPTNARILATKAKLPPPLPKAKKAKKTKKPKSPPPKPKSPPPKPKSPPPKPKSPPPKPKSPPPKPKSPPPKPKSPPPKPKSPPPKPMSPPPAPLKSPPPPLKSPPPAPLKSPPPSPLRSPPPPSPPPPALSSHPPPALSSHPPPALSSPPPPALSSHPPPALPSPPPLSSPPPPALPSPPPLSSPPPPALPSPPPLSSPPPPALPSPPPLSSPPPPALPSPPPLSSPPPVSSPPPPRSGARWDKYYMNNWTPANPPGGLVLSDDQLHVDMKITSRNEIFGNFLTQNRFIFGYFSIYMKLIPNDSAGTVMTYYFSSPENHTKDGNGNDLDTHDEIDFEFLGNTSGNPITLQTNIYLNGKANREQRHYLPFDPSADFHKYSLLWNQNLIIWYVDDSVIRVHNNKGGVPYPTWRPMAVVASLWNGSNWATQGGSQKLNISHQPFVLQYEGFDGVDGCDVCPTNQFTDPSPDCPMAPNNPNLAVCNSGNSWNDQSVLSDTQIAQLKAHEQNYIIYNYCYDYKRFGGISKIPPECQYNEYT